MSHEDKRAKALRMLRRGRARQGRAWQGMDANSVVRFASWHPAANHVAPKP